METDNSRAQCEQFISVYWEILLCNEVQNIFLFPHGQYRVAHHIIWNIFLDWKGIAGIYWKISEHLCSACLASEGLLVGILPSLLSPSAAAHHPFSCAGAEEDVFISSGDAFSDAVDKGVLVTGVLTLPSWAGLCPLPQVTWLFMRQRTTQPGVTSSV